MRPISCHSPVIWSGVILTSECYRHYSVWADRDKRCKTYFHYRGVKDSGNREKSYAWRSERKVHAARLLLSHCYDVMISDQSTSNTELSFQVLSYLRHSLISVRILGLSIFTATRTGKMNQFQSTWSVKTNYALIIYCGLQKIMAHKRLSHAHNI